MNDEIKEILKILKKCEFGACITKHNSKVLLDYITNLQQENEDYKSRVEKAVEYIKTKGLKEEEWQNGFCEKATATYTREEIFDLLNILQGENNE